MAEGLKYYLGVDVGSSYTKICVVNGEGLVIEKQVVATFSKERLELTRIFDNISGRVGPAKICATGFGRESIHFALNGLPVLRKTEIICAAAGTQYLYPFPRTILDIGGEDIKVIQADAAGIVRDFYMNTKCAAGTGTFITEIAEKAGITAEEMNNLAEESQSNKELNSFCTVFAKTEILNWLLSGISLPDVARGIYLSVASRISKLKLDPAFPVILVGGVAKYHPYFKNILEQTITQIIYTPECPQFIPAYGAALLARKSEGVSVENKAVSTQNPFL